MSVVSLSRQLANQLYKGAFPLYRPLYSAFKAFSDRRERRLLAGYLTQTSVAIDVGANIGVYSCFLSRCVGDTGIVHSFEPSPDNFSRLHAAVARCPNVHANLLGVGDRTGEQVLYVSDDLNVDHRLYPTIGEPRTRVRIRTTRLDDYIPPGSRVDLIKLDIQGYELHALRGADRVLADNSAVKLLLEFWPYGLRQAGAPWKDLVEFLQGRGFTLHEVSSDDLRPFNPNAVVEEADWYINLFASRES